MQLEVFANPLVRARRAFPYVSVLQADIATLGRERIIAFLAAKTQIGPASGRLMPIVLLAAGDLSAFRDRIVDAIDWTFLGISSPNRAC